MERFTGRAANNFLVSPMAGVMPETETINREAARAGSPRRSHQVAAGQGAARRRRRNRSKTAAQSARFSATGAKKSHPGIYRRRIPPISPSPIDHPDSNPSSYPAGAGQADQHWQPE